MSIFAAIKSWADLGAFADSALVLAIGVVALVRAQTQPDETKKDQARKAGYFLIILGLVLLGRHFI